MKRQKMFFTSNRSQSRFGECPLCSLSFPRHRLEVHASSCNGREDEIGDGSGDTLLVPSTRSQQLPRKKARLENSTIGNDSARLPCITPEPTAEPISGLYIFENFITEQEERELLHGLDVEDTVPWKVSRFNGLSFGKRWGVHCNLRDRRVDAPEHPLPDCVQRIVLPKLQKLSKYMKDIVPNEANAIDYRRRQGHWLKAHVDDRKLSLESIANISLAGECHMTFRNQASSRNLECQELKVLLKPRCLQILTGKARYDFSHAIAHQDLNTDRRVSITLRQSPLTHLQPQLKFQNNNNGKPTLGDHR